MFNGDTHMKKNCYIILMILIGNSLLLKALGTLYIQNDTQRPIEFERISTVPGMSKLMTYTVGPGEKKATPSDNLKSIEARFINDFFRKLNVGSAILNAQKEGISSIIHIVPGTYFGVKVGGIQQLYDDIEISVSDKMKILNPLGLSLQDVYILKFSKALAGKILQISPESKKEQAEAAYLSLAKQKVPGLSEGANNYRGYLLTKALKAFEH